MRKNSLLKTNPYLKNPAERRRLIYKSVVTSTAIEGVHVPSKKPNVSKKGKKAA